MLTGWQAWFQPFGWKGEHGESRRIGIERPISKADVPSVHRLATQPHAPKQANQCNARPHHCTNDDGSLQHARVANSILGEYPPEPHRPGNPRETESVRSITHRQARPPRPHRIMVASTIFAFYPKPHRQARVSRSCLPFKKVQENRQDETSRNEYPDQTGCVPHRTPRATPFLP